MRTETNLFAPYKALGLICSSVPPAWAPPVPSRAHFHDGYVFCALDNVVAAYGLGRYFRLAFTTNALDDGTVSLLAADPYRHYACFANKTIVAVIRNRTIERRLFVDGGPPKLLLSLTDTLVVVDSANGIHLFDVRTGQPLVHLDSTESFQITAIVHPITYMNKILVGAADGRMRLWNLSAGRLVHEFPVSDAFNAPILVLEQSPAIDVIGVGLADGRIHLRNIKFDKLICTFRHDGQITALAFRTDGVDTMVSANSEGSLAIWDLNERQLLGLLPTAHSAKITWLHFVPGQPHLISAGADNRIVKWFFRTEVALPEIDTALEGHSEPVSAIRFCAEHMIVSAGRDGHVRRFTTGTGEKRGGSVHFGKAREVKKGDLSKDRFMDVLLNPIVQIELSHGREAVWDNMICRHEHSPLVSTWSTRRGTRGAHLFCHERFTKNARFLDAVVTAMCVSCCGTFAFLGHSSGHVDAWNMQSGQWKFELQRQPEQQQQHHQQMEDGTKMSGGDGNAAVPIKQQQQGRNGWKKRGGAALLPAHDGAVTGLAMDLFNRHLVTGSDDGTVQFWQFRAQGAGAVLVSRLRVGDAVQQFRLDVHNSLLAVGLRGGEVGVLDVLCRRIARRFSHSSCMEWPQNARLTGLDFSSDGKWLVSADNQCFLKVWDLVTGTLIDVMRCASACVGVAFSERNDFLATCHEGQRGVYLWANKTMFLASHSMWTCAEEELHDRAMGSTMALPTTCQTGTYYEDIDDEQQQQQQQLLEGEDEAEAVQQQQHGEDEQRSQQEDEEVMEEEREEQMEARKAAGGGEEKQQDEDDENSIGTIETRVMIDEDEEEEDGGEGGGGGGAPSLSTLSLDGSAELPERAQLDPSLYTMSGLAPARWAGLPHLEHIRQRNKPKEPPKKPKAAPFFLPTVATTKGFEFDTEAMDKLKREDGDDDADEDNAMEEEGTSSTMAQQQQEKEEVQDEQGDEQQEVAAAEGMRTMLRGKRRNAAGNGQQQLHTEWTWRLMSASTDDQLRAVFAELREMSLSGMDLHLRCLSTTAELAQFVAMLVAQMECRRDFDLAQSLLAAFLNIHHSALWTTKPDANSNENGGGTVSNTTTSTATEMDDAAALLLTHQMDRLHTAQRKAHDTLAKLFDDNMAMVEFVKSAIA